MPMAAAVAATRSGLRDFQELERLAKSGVKKLAVLCPAFVADCLETIEEIGVRGKETFMKAGGEEFTLIPCLNDQRFWVEALAEMLEPCFQDSQVAA